MISLLVLLPLVLGLLTMASRHHRAHRGLLLLSALAHNALTLFFFFTPPSPALEGWLALDALGLLFLSITSFLFLMATVYAIGYLKREEQYPHQDFEEGFWFNSAPEAIFAGCLQIFLAAMSLVTISRHFGLLWVAMEATTLASAPLIYYHRHHRSLEATWKYLIICSVGIALALLGNFFLSAAVTTGHASHVPMLVDRLIQSHTQLDPRWLKLSFLFFLVGYGTKMGLAPLHTWLPDAHSESPSLVSALLSGALLNCAFLGILRAMQVCESAGLGDFCRELLLVFGLFSMLLAAVFIIGQTDYKRLLAYSSVEHMGILALGIGLGKGAVWGALYHAVNHSCTKAMLFLLAGNILAHYQTKLSKDITGLVRVLPITGVLWLAGFLAITGSPPFGTFISEFTILQSALHQEQYLVALLYLLFLGVIFIGMVFPFLHMAQGAADPKKHAANETWTAVLPPIALGLAGLTFGLVGPMALQQVLLQSVQILGGQ
ncbi:MAG: proton-conducting transporter membrane subunit [bacterium]|jgi:hydrogenase-4 component F|nr:proton-conducting transporter membrane subunit [bacterium]